MIDNPSSPETEWDILPQQNAPDRETPDEEDGGQSDDRVEADLPNERNPELHPDALVLKFLINVKRIVMLQPTSFHYYAYSILFLKKTSVILKILKMS